MSEVMEPKAEAKAKKPALKQYKITFHGDGGDVELVHNYVLNVYKRNVPTTIDENFLSVLKDAVIHTRIQDADGKWRDVTIPTIQYTLES